MRNIDMILDSFVNGDYFIVFLVVILVILLVLVLALIKTREDYNELLMKEENRETKPIINIEKEDNDILEEDDLMDDLESLMSSSDEEDKIDADKPLIKQVDLKNIKTYDDVIEEYQNIDEENAVISAEELEKKAKERLENLGSTENQEAIMKYEEEKEKKEIISYEQLLENASNITLSYKEEKNSKKGAPKVNKVEIEQKEVTDSQMYIEEEEFLKILKEFRISLE